MALQQGIYVHVSMCTVIAIILSVSVTDAVLTYTAQFLHQQVS